MPHQNPKTNSISPERIRLLNFPLVSFSQHNTNSIAIFRHNIYFYQYNSPNILLISLHFVDRHIALNQSAASMTLWKPRHSFSHFILATIL